MYYIYLTCAVIRMNSDNGASRIYVIHFFGLIFLLLCSKYEHKVLLHCFFFNSVNLKSEETLKHTQVLEAG